MLSDEEKKAMKDCDIIFINLEDMMSEEEAKDYRKSYKILKNLIEKQQKEIEELKKYKKYYEEMEEVNKKFIAVDKIKEKIKELKKQDKENKLSHNYLVIPVLQSLLEKE